MNLQKHGDDRNHQMPNFPPEYRPDSFYNTKKSRIPASGKSLKEHLSSLRETGFKLVQEGRMIEGIGCYSSMFNLFKTMGEPDGIEFIRVFHESMEELNKIAMKYIQNNDTESGHQILTFCEECTQTGKYGTFPLLRTKTFNNIACLYRRVNKPKGALNYLRSALTILGKNNLMKYSAVTYLNLSAVQSQLGDHQQALVNAKNALIYAQEELLLDKEKLQEDRDQLKEKVVTLAIAYHNMGSEEEHLNNLKNAVGWYEKSFLVMDEYQIGDEKLYKKFQTIHLAVLDKLTISEIHGPRRTFSPIGSKRPRTSIKDSISSAFGDYSPVHSPIRPQNPPKRGSVDIHHRKPAPQSISVRVKKSRSQQKGSKTFGKPVIVYSNPSSTLHPNQAMSRPSSATSDARLNVKPFSQTHGGAFQNSFSNSPIKASPEKHYAHSAGFAPDDAENKSNKSLDQLERESYSPSHDTSRHNMASEVDEIKNLENMGILDWSDSDTESKRQKIDKEEIKKNQKNFFAHLKDANVRNLSGQFKLISSSSSDSSSSSSRSSSADEKKKKKKKKNKKAKKEKKEKKEKSKSKTKDSKEKKNAEEIDEDLVEDINDDASSISLISNKIDRSANKSKLDRTDRASVLLGEKASTTTKLGQENKSIFNAQKRTEAGNVAKGTRLSGIDKSKFGSGMQSFSYINPNMQSQVAFTEESEGEGNQTAISPPVKLTKEQLKAQAKQRQEAALLIQKNYKGKLARDRVEAMKKYKEKMGSKYLIQKRWLLLAPKKTVGKKTVDGEISDYSLNVLVDPEIERLLFFLNDCSEKVKYDIQVSYADKPLKRGEKITSLSNHKILSKLADDTVKRFMIVDHLLLLSEEHKDEEEESENGALRKFSTFGARSDEGNEDDRTSQPPDSARKKAEKRKHPGRYKQDLATIIKIQSFIKGHLQRQLYKLRPQQKWKFLFKQVTRVDEQLISFKLMQNTWDKRYYVSALHEETKKNFMRLEVPIKLLDSLQGNYNQLVDKFEFDFTTYMITFMPAVEAMLFPETRQKHVEKYEVDNIIKIQRNVKRYLARQMYKLMLTRVRKNPHLKLLKKYSMTKNNTIFAVLMYYNTEHKSFVVHARSQGYLAQVKPLNISASEVDKYDLKNNMANIRRLNDIIQPYITIEKNRDGMYALNFNKKDYERNGRRFETQLMSYTDLDILGDHKDGDREDVHNKVWKFLQDKNFIETNQHILKNIMGLQTVSDSVKIMEELEPAIKQLGKAENSAATKIQKKYRKWAFKKNSETILKKQREIMNQKSVSSMIANSVRDKSYSLFSKLYHRFALTEEELKRENTTDIAFVKTVSDVSFRNTHLEAKIHVFHNKKNLKEKTIDLEIIMPIIGHHQNLQIPEQQILEKSHSFLKKVNEHILGRFLDYDEEKKKVVFNPHAKHIGDSEVFESIKHEINPYVQAKLARLKYLKRKIKEKSMLLLKVETVRISNFFVQMTFYWHLMKRQLRIMLEQIDNLTYQKEIIVKFDSLYNSSELRGLVNDLNIQQNEFVKKISPYLDYISRHIHLQPDSKTGGKEFSIMIDTSVLQLVFSNEKFILTSFRDMSSNILNDIAHSGSKAIQAHLKFLAKTAKMTDVKEFGKKFTRKPRFENVTKHETIEKPIDLDEMEENFAKQKSIAIHRIPERDMAFERRKAALTIQKILKGCLVRQRYNYQKAGRALLNKRAQLHGVRIKRTIKKIDNQYWTITITKKTQHEAGASIYYFIAVNLSDQTRAKTVAKGHFRYNNMLLVNSEGKDLADFLLDRIEINGQTIEFNLNFENATNFVKVEPAPKNADHIRTIEPEEEVKETPPKKEHTGAAGEFLEVPDAKNKPKVVQDKNASFSAALHAAGGDFGLLKAEGPPKRAHEDNLLQQKAESILNNLLLYNVYYNQDQNALDSVINPLIQNPQSTPEDVKALLRQGAVKKKGNTVKIDVELAELKKYLPHLAPKSIQDLKQIAGELANSIQINEKGEVLVNHAKLNPNVLSVLEKKLGSIESKDTKAFDKNKNSKKKVLFKMTKAYGEKKYLLLINYLEKLSSINDVLTLTGREEDQVYEDFEMFLEISALCLSNSALQPLVWELSLQEAQRLSGHTNINEISKFFVNNLHIYGDRFLLVTRSKVYANSPVVISMNEKVVRIIQNKFRSRKFITNFRKFKENLLSLKNKLVTRAMISINNTTYHVFGYEKNNSELELEVWDLANYEKYDLEIPKRVVERVYSKDKKAAFDYLFKFITFEFNKKKEYGLVLKEKELAEYLSKNKWSF